MLHLQGRRAASSLASCFSQFTHKSTTVFQVHLFNLSPSCSFLLWFCPFLSSSEFSQGLTFQLFFLFYFRLKFMSGHSSLICSRFTLYLCIYISILHFSYFQDAFSYLDLCCSINLHFQVLLFRRMQSWRRSWSTFGRSWQRLEGWERPPRERDKRPSGFCKRRWGKPTKMKKQSRMKWWLAVRDSRQKTLTKTSLSTKLRMAVRKVLLQILSTGLKRVTLVKAKDWQMMLPIVSPLQRGKIWLSAKHWWAHHDFVCHNKYSLAMIGTMDIQNKSQ